jgi:hypothetical protein
MTERLDIGGVLSRVFQYYGQQASLLLPAALLVFIPVAVINGVLRTEGGILVALCAAVIGLIGTYWFQGMVVEAVRDMQDGVRDFDLGGLFRSVLPVLATLIGAGVLAGIAIGIGLILLIVPGLILLTIWAVLAPVIVVERTGVFDAFGRSRALVKNSGWQVFGVIVLLFIIQFIASLVLTGIAIAITDSFVGYAVAQLIANVFIAPLAALASATMYFELRRLHGEAPVSAAAGPPTEAAPPAPAPGTPPPPPPPPSGGARPPGSVPPPSGPPPAG